MIYFNLKNKTSSGRPVEIYEELLGTTVKMNLTVIIRKLVLELNVAYVTITNLRCALFQKDNAYHHTVRDTSAQLEEIG